MHICFILPGDINTPTGGYRYNRCLLECWQSSGHHVDLISLAGTYPFATKSDIEAGLKLISRHQTCHIAVIDGLAGGGAPELIRHTVQYMPVVALIHHPLFLENGLSEQEAAYLKQREEAGLQSVSAICTTSPTTTQSVQKLFHVPSERIHTVIPGVRPAPPAQSGDKATLKLLSIGSLIERKGHDILIQALAGLKHLPWHLDLIGSASFNPALAVKLKKMIVDEGLSEQISLHGALSEAEIDQFYDHADIFVLASRFEGYGMVYSEAIMRALPIIATTAGAIPQTVPASCGLLVPPEDITALAGSLYQMMIDQNLRREKRLGCLAARSQLPSWAQSAERFYRVLHDLVRQDL